MDTSITRIPTGSIGLDIALGGMYRRNDGIWVTGYPPGLTEIVGDPGSGRTTLCIQAAANAQALGLRTAYLDMEHTLDISYAQKLGVDMTRLYFSQPSSGEQCMQIADKLVRSGQFGLVVADELHQAPRFAELHEAVRAAGSHLIVVTCLPLVAADTSIHVHRTTPITLKGEELGFRAAAKVVGTGRETDFPLIYGTGTDHRDELIDHCLLEGIVELWSGYRAYGRVIAREKWLAAGRISRDRALAYNLYNDLLTRLSTTVPASVSR